MILSLHKVHYLIEQIGFTDAASDQMTALPMDISSMLVNHLFVLIKN